MKLNKKKHNLRNIAICILGLILVLVVIGFIYIQDYYHADNEAIEAFSANVTNISKETLDNGYKVYAPKDATTGLIFYPGGKVEYNSYAPLMEACSNQGILCILVEMPANLAVLDMDAADGLQQKYPEITSWYIGGHSLGGSMAASYVADQTDSFDGLVLLGAYSTADLKDTGLSVLSMYGSEDQVLNHQKYEQYKGNLPSNFKEVIIKGGNHAGFGMYGAQAGDGTSTITNEEQISQTAKHISDFVKINK